MRNVQCPYCGNPARLEDSAIIYSRSYGMIWDCRPCDAYVGTHKGSKDHAPLGRLADRELREWKKRAHAAFDPLWKSGRITRPEAYKHLQELMGMTADQAHIGKFDVAECMALVEALIEF
jgi:hypothetical protein